MSTDEKDLEIAKLKGQVEAYQGQMRSMAIDLLRRQVSELQKGESKRESSIEALHHAFGRLEATVNDRIDKASAAFVDLQKRIEALEGQKDA